MASEARIVKKVLLEYQLRWNLFDKLITALAQFVVLFKPNRDPE